MDNYEFLAVFFLLLILSIPVLAIIAIVKASRASRELADFKNKMADKFDELEHAINESRVPMAEEPTSDVVAEKIPEDTVSEAVKQEDQTQHNEDESDDPAPGEQSADETPESLEDTGGQEDETSAGKPWIQAARNRKEQPKSPKLDLESLIGGRWSVLLGGLTLALGIVFLVRYSIEAGLLGPGMRTLLGALFSTLAIAAGEWLRRSDRDFGLPVYEKADVPGVLTGAGAIGAFATLYAAHALYGFIGPGVAFIGLTLVGIATMLASALHGPKLAAIGLLGAYATPMLVSSSEPNHIALALHVFIVTATVLTLAHVREWRWLAVAGFVGSTLWVFLQAAGSGNGNLAGIAGLVLVVGLAALFAAAFFLRENAEVEDHRVEKSAILAFSLLTVSFFIQLAINADLPATTTATITSLLIIGVASVRTSIAPVGICASVLTILSVAASDLTPEIIDGLTQTGDLKAGLVPPDTTAFAWNALLLAVPPAILALWGARRTSGSAPIASGWLASATASLAFFVLVVTYLRIAPFETRPLIGSVALAVAGLLTIATEAFIRISPDNKKAPAPAALAVGAISSACLALSI